MKTRLTLVVLAWCVMSALVPGAQAQPAGYAQCFYSNEWVDNWRASPDAKAIYFRIEANRIYRLDLAQACPDLLLPEARLIVSSHEGGAYCGPLDFDLHVATPHGVPAGCFVAHMSQLTSSEVAAPPRSLRP